MTRDTRFSLPLYAVIPALLALLAVGVQVLEAQVWVPKGPGPGVQGAGPAATENLAGNPFSGALEAVVAHPTNPNILWVGSVNGGIFRTDNATSPTPNWTAQTDGQASLSIGALERDPTDLSHNTLVAGIGVQSSFGDDTGGLRTGLLRTTNGGTTWTSLPFLTPGNIVGLAPRGSTIVAAFDGPGSSCSFVGIWRSVNTGVSFTQISNSAALPCGFALDLASDPTNNNRLFAPITGSPSASDSGLYRSVDAGATWTQVGSGSVLDTALQANPKEVQVTVGKAGGATSNVFVAVCAVNKLTGLFHSANAGNSWTALDIPFTTELGTQYGIHPGGQCGIHLSLAADPADPNVVYIGGDRQPANNENGGMGVQFPNSSGATTYSARIFKVNAALTAGSQASPITHCKTAGFAGCKGSRRTANGTAPHADSREMVFDANGDLIETDDGGVYRHTNPKGTNGDWFPVIGDLPVSEAHSSAYDTVSNILIAGLQDNNVVEQMSPGNNAWGTVRGGDGGDVAVGLHDPVAGQSTRYSSSQNLGQAVRFTYNANNVFQSGFFLSLTPLGGSPAIVPQFVTPVAINAADPTRLVVGAVNGVYESFDRLSSVTRIATERIGTGGAKSALAYGVPSNHNALYYGAASFVYVRLAAPPAAPTITSPSSGFDSDTITDVAIDRANALTAVAVDKNSVYGTSDPLFTGWSTITGNLPTVADLNRGNMINTVEFFNSGFYRAVVGTNRGVFQSTAASGFTSWAPLGTGLPNALVYELTYDPENDVLIAGTMGRGVWSLSLDATGCPWERIFANTTLGGAQTQKADGVIYLGPNLTINNATGVTMRAGEQITFGDNTTILGTFTAELGSCP